MDTQPDTIVETAEFWQHHVEQYQKTQQSKVSYYRQHQLNYYRFIYWVAKLTKPSEAKPTPNTLIAVKLQSQSSEHPVLATLQLANSLCLSLLKGCA